MRLQFLLIALASLHAILCCQVRSVSSVATFSEEDSHSTCNYLIVAGVTSSSWKLYIFDINKQLVQKVTDGASDDQMPALSPDRQKIAFASRRSGNWDIFTLDLTRGSVYQLTDDLAYDGWPAWSPDGEQIAFESYRDGSLNIYTISAEGGTASRITEGDAPKVEPIWVGDGKRLVYTSWENSTRQLYLLDLVAHNVSPLTDPEERPQQATMSPDGRWIAYLDSASFNTLTIRDLVKDTVKRVSDARGAEWPTWLPNTRGDVMPDLLTLIPEGGGAYRYPGDWLFGWPLGMDHVVPFPSPSLPGQWQRPTCVRDEQIRLPDRWEPVWQVLNLPTPETVPGLVPLSGVQGLQPRLAAAVAPSFQRLRQSVLKETGYDFLAALNDAWRGLDHPFSKYLSWHKTGRAMDVRDWYCPGGRNIVEIVRQDLDGKTYFRMYLRTARQDGSQGAPLRSMIWNAVARLNDAEAARQGGREMMAPSGYYVDFTDLAAREGWTRIPALTPPDGDWRQNVLDLEFWHYERRDGLNWYSAMGLIYREEDLRQRFTAQQALAHGYSFQAILHAGLPGTAQLLRSMSFGPC